MTISLCDLGLVTHPLCTPVSLLYKMRARIQLCLHQDPQHAACSAGPSSAPGPLQTWVQRAEATMSHFLAGSGDHLSQMLAKGVSPREERPFRVATRVGSLWLLNTAQHTVSPLPVSHPSSFSQFYPHSFILPASFFSPHCLYLLTTTSIHRRGPALENCPPPPRKRLPQSGRKATSPWARGLSSANSREWKPDL